MKKHYCSYELSMLAKKAGFDELCVQVAIFNNNKLNCEIIEDKNIANWRNIEMTHDLSCTLPELTHLQQWCYEKFGVWITAKSIAREKATMFTQSNSLNSKDFDCPYKALENGLMEFLKTKHNEKNNQISN